MNLVLIIFLLVGVVGVELSPDEDQRLNQLLDENIVFEFDEVEMEGISNILSGSIIEVKKFQLFGKDCNSRQDCGYTTHKILKSDDSLVEITDSGVLLPFINPDFRLSSEADAQAFEGLLDALFPVFFSSDKENYREGNYWIFIREDSFGEKNGVVVRVDDEGLILKVENVSAIEKPIQIEELGEVE